MDYLPIFVDLRGRTVLFAGGGEDIARKVRLLARTPARLVLVAPALNEELAGLVRDGRIDWIARAFAADQLAGATLAFAAADAATNAAVASAARARSIPVNVVDHAALSGFITPAIVDRDPVIIAIGTEGTGPVLAQGLRARIEAILPARLGDLARLAQSVREPAARALKPGPARRRFWKDFFFGGLAERLLQAAAAARSAAVGDALLRHRDETAAATVSYVVADERDTGLLTLKAVQRMQDADLVVHGPASGARVLDHCRRDALRVRSFGALTGAAIAGLPGKAAHIVRLLPPGADRDPAIAAEQTRFEAAGWAVEIVANASETASDWAVLCDGPGRDDAEHRRLAS